MTNPFKLIKLYFTERDYYEQRKRYMKLQKKYRKEMKAQAKEFCPWSGWYMHKMIVTMLEFYFKTYEAHDCCWSESAWEGKTAVYLKEALDWAEKLDAIDDMECSELLKVALLDKPEFEAYVKEQEKLFDTTIKEENLGYTAYGYLEKKYTKAMYNVIGEHIWEWMD